MLLYKYYSSGAACRAMAMDAYLCDKVLLEIFRFRDDTIWIPLLEPGNHIWV